MNITLKNIELKIIISLFFLFLNSGCTAQSTTDERVTTQVIDSCPARMNIDKRYLLGKIDATKDTILREIPKEYCLYRKEYLRNDVIDAYVSMYNAAKLDDIELKIVSAFRDFDTQKWLWERKWKSDKNSITNITEIIKYSAMPGTSRHHWGTDIDLCNLDNSWWSSVAGKKTYDWLLENASKFGFAQPYTANRSSGYLEEKWHWSFVEIAKCYQNNYKEKIEYSDISGFKGADNAHKINLIDNYVFGINTIFLTP
jgi:hypothetical protein